MLSFAIINGKYTHLSLKLGVHFVGQNEVHMKMILNSLVLNFLLSLNRNSS